MTTPAPSGVDSVMQQRLQACETTWQAWLATLTARGITCDDAQRVRMVTALPHLDRIRQRLRDWRPLDDSFDARFEQEKHGAR